MLTNPLLARRVIPRKERVQKALLVLVAVGVVVAATWMYTDGSLERSLTYLLSVGVMAFLGIVVSLFVGLKKYETAKDKEDIQLLRMRIDDDEQGRGWIARVGFNIKRLLASVVILAGVLFGLAGGGIFGVQLYGYLKFGEWSSFSSFDIASRYLPWLRDPHSWFGLHKIVSDAFDIVPMSLALVMMGLLVAGLGFGIRGRVRR